MGGGVSSFLLILSLIFVAGSEADIKWNRLPKSSLIDYTGPQQLEGAMVELIGERNSDGEINKIETKQRLEKGKHKGIKKQMRGHKNGGENRIRQEGEYITKYYSVCTVLDSRIRNIEYYFSYYFPSHPFLFSSVV